MELSIYQVDAFTQGAFTGNPAAICPLEQWLPDETLQAIAEENNLAETAFFAREGNSYRLRWFTPLVEVDLCGHATLAAAWVLFEQLNHPSDSISFMTRSGELVVSRHTQGLAMNFPSDIPTSYSHSSEYPVNTATALGIAPIKVLKGADLLFIFENQSEIEQLQPQKETLMQWPLRGVICTAPANNAKVDFVSRFFGPKVGIDEDHATGSAHCTLTPYWSERLNKKSLCAEQLSPRKAYFSCENLDGRVAIIGDCHLYLKGTIFI